MQFREIIRTLPKLAATLLKVMTLLDWHQIGMFAAIYAIRFMIKQNFRREQQE